MKTTSRKRMGVLALAAFLSTSAASLAGCGGLTATAIDTSATTAAGAASAATEGGGTSATASAATSATTAAAAQTTTEQSSSYWNTCRRGKTDDAYPGDCHDYVDTNGDDICDLSQPDPDDSASAASLASAATASSTADDDSQTGGCPLGPCVICGICANFS